MSYDAAPRRGSGAAVADGASASDEQVSTRATSPEMEGGAVTVSGGATVAFDACEFANNTVWYAQLPTATAPWPPRRAASVSAR